MKTVLKSVVIVPTSAHFVQGYVQEVHGSRMHFALCACNVVGLVQQNVANTLTMRIVAKNVQRLAKNAQKRVRCKQLRHTS